MPFPPIQPTDALELAGRAFNALPSLDNNRQLPGFGAPNPPSVSGTGIRQRSIPNERGAVFTRNMVRWFVPEVGVVEMYINPQQISYNHKKQISNQRTRGGYVLQYWGEEIFPLTISGTTGSSGVEGINVLYDIYRAEQNSYDPFALALSAEASSENDIISSALSGDLNSLIGGAVSGISNLVSNAVESGSPTTTRPKPTLASLAFSVEMYWSGWVFRGYFTDFRVDERADRLGLFDYTITFMCTQRRGFRSNFLGWHRSAVSGPSNSDPEFGRPYSYRGLYSEQFTSSNTATPNQGISLVDALESGASLVGNSLSTAFSSIF